MTTITRPVITRPEVTARPLGVAHVSDAGLGRMRAVFEDARRRAQSAGHVDVLRLAEERLAAIDAELEIRGLAGQEGSNGG